MYFVKKWGLYAPTWETLQLQKLTSTAIDARIRRLAAAEDLVAFKHRGLWYFKDYHNSLQSPETGLDQQEAWEYLTETGEQHSRDLEFQAVIEELAAQYPGTVDYHTADCEKFDLLNKDDEIIATIDEREMTGIWNAVELVSPEAPQDEEIEEVPA